ncbi:MAG: hypothetical protein RIE86_20455 [Imperialibacter sp.]|uniref:Uncharacterized protein n=1 Tax=Imperialibacter roseus TaxID=1324217 RepID=A0ABZ0IRH7_9BACT|nr:hypothetical protein [Imperialibacter roseus]WOK07181.1 hypothetical protein RT717_00920 [Imperialibacter roseus]
MINLRRVQIKFSAKGKNLGYFHRFVYIQNDFQSTTKALIELDSGDLELVDLLSIKFIDRKHQKSEESKSDDEDDE